MAARLMAAITVATLMTGAGMTGAALAQTGSTGGDVRSGTAQSARSTLDLGGLKPVSEYELTVTYNGKSPADIKEANVKDANGDTIGQVDKVLADERGAVVAVTVEAGDALGTARKEVVLPVDRLAFEPNAKQFTTSLSKDDLKTLPEWRR